MCCIFIQSNIVYSVFYSITNLEITQVGILFSRNSLFCKLFNTSGLFNELHFNTFKSTLGNISISKQNINIFPCLYMMRLAVRQITSLN